MDDEPTHLDLFTGIGGFALAAREAGFKTIGMCEIDKRCRDFLARAWPGIPIEEDIRKLDGRKYAGVTLLSGGPPCQPTSRAGKRRGKSDERWLWEETLRVTDEAEPNCFVLENPLGLSDLAEYRVSPPMDGSGFAIGNIGDTFSRTGRAIIDKILEDLGSLGYETQCFDIPACAVDSPQLRHRIWIVGFLADHLRSRGENKIPLRSGRSRQSPTDNSGDHGRVADASRNRERGHETPTRPDSKRARASQQRDVADAESGGLGADGSARRKTRHADQRNENDLANTDKKGRSSQRRAEGDQGDFRRRSDHKSATLTKPSGSELGNAEQRRAMQTGWQSRSLDRADRPTASSWQNFVWVPCADGKFRRAPDESLNVAHGLHRSVLAALGNAICPQVVIEILKAIREQIAYS